MPYMAQTTQLTEMEKFYLEEQLKHEQLVMKKCDQYAPQIQDSDLRSIIDRTRTTSQRHVDALSGVLRQAGFSPPS